MTFYYDFHRVMLDHYTAMLPEAKGWKHKQFVRESIQHHQNRIHDFENDIPPVQMPVVHGMPDELLQGTGLRELPF